MNFIGHFSEMGFLQAGNISDSDLDWNCCRIEAIFYLIIGGKKRYNGSCSTSLGGFQIEGIKSATIKVEKESLKRANPK